MRQFNLMVSKRLPIIVISIWLFIFALMVILITTSVYSEIVATPTPLPLAPAKMVIANDLALTELWRWSQRENPDVWLEKFTVTDEVLILVTREAGLTKLTAFNAQNERLIWSHPVSGAIYSLAFDDKQVYVSTTRFVQTYDLETGAEIWKGARQKSGKRGGLVVYNNEGQIEVADHISGRLYTLNPQTGETLRMIEHPDIAFHQDEIYFSSSCFSGCALIATNSQQNNTLLWQRRFSKPPRIYPRIVDGILFVVADRIYALDAETGQVVWQTQDDFVTGIAFVAPLIYAIRSDAAIVGLNYRTGQNEGVVSISPNRTYQDDYLFQYDLIFRIATSDEFVVVYYGNSSDLIVFKRTSSSARLPPFD